MYITTPFSNIACHIINARRTYARVSPRLRQIPLLDIAVRRRQITELPMTSSFESIISPIWIPIRTGMAGDSKNWICNS